MKRLIVESYLLLLQIEFLMSFRSILSLYEKVKSARPCSPAWRTNHSGRATLSRDGLCLRFVPKASALSPAFRGDDTSSTQARHRGGNGNRRAAVAIQVSRMGRVGGRSRQ